MFCFIIDKLVKLLQKTAYTFQFKGVCKASLLPTLWACFCQCSLTTTVPKVSARLTTHNRGARTVADKRRFWWTNFTNSAWEALAVPLVSVA